MTRAKKSYHKLIIIKTDFWNVSDRSWDAESNAANHLILSLFLSALGVFIVRNLKKQVQRFTIFFWAVVKYEESNGVTNDMRNDAISSS